MSCDKLVIATLGCEGPLQLVCYRSATNEACDEQEGGRFTGTAGQTFGSVRVSRFPSVPMLAASLALAACGGESSTADRSNSANAVAPAPDNGAAATGTQARPAAGTDGEAVTAIPARFHGTWDSSAAACAGPPGEMRLVVEPDRLRFHESVARVLAVEPAGEEINVDLGFEGEGETWQEVRMLRLDAQGRLDVATSNDSATRVRCSAG